MTSSRFSPTSAVLLVGCGRMGGALLRAWRGGERPLFVLDPSAGDLVGATLIADEAAIADLPRPLIVVLAVKPALVEAVARDIAPFCGPGVACVSIAAGISLGALERALAPLRDIVRAMPNTAVDTGDGATALVAGEGARPDALAACEALFGAAGLTARLDREEQMDAATAVSGSGPAYFFAFAEALAQAGERLGLSQDVAMTLARQTLVGAGALASARGETLAALRTEVTSPGGTTAAALDRFERAEDLQRLVMDAAAHAAVRSAALGAAKAPT